MRGDLGTTDFSGERKESIYHLNVGLLGSSLCGKGI